MTAAAQPDQLLKIAVEVAREAAALAQRYRVEGIGDVGIKSTTTDIVTAADRAVERLIVGLFRERRPGDAVLGEEFGAQHVGESGPSEASAVRWVVDPIDGTVNYVYGLEHYAVSIAAEVDGVSVAGVVTNAATGQEWTALRGGGAWRDGRRLTGSNQTDLGQALLATGFGYHPARRAYQAQVLAHVLPRVRDVRRFGAASLDLCLVAEGQVDVYYETGLNAWDHAAGGLIATEAGLRVAGLRGAAASSTMVVAAPPALFEPLQDLLTSLAADAGP
jgi:myo-inositol-1(or 4)-monophosphatase